MKTGRRGFLGLMAAAPMSAPALAKEAASKMGLTAVTEAVSDPHGLNVAVPLSGGHPVDNSSWAKAALKEMFSSAKVEDRYRQARHMARSLDADLAACRSMSPSVAYQKQTERCYQRLTEQERSWFEREAGII